MTSGACYDLITNYPTSIALLAVILRRKTVSEQMVLYAILKRQADRFDSY